MRKPTTLLPAFALGVAGAILGATSALAFPITYTEQATASGSLNGVSFTDKIVLLAMTSDTTNVINPSAGVFENVTSAVVKATVSVDSAAAVTFTDSIAVFVNQTPTLPPAVGGFADLTLSLDILDTSSASFAAYDLKSFIGPISGNPAFMSLNQSFPTTGGGFILTGISNDTSTFTAPAPLIGRGLAAALVLAGALFGAKLFEHHKKRALAV
jgi:hypothetical protein